MTSNKGGGAGRRDASPVISASVTPALAGTTSQSRARASPRVDSALSSLVPGHAERLTPSKQRAVRILSSSETRLDEADDYEQSYAEMMILTAAVSRCADGSGTLPSARPTSRLDALRVRSASGWNERCASQWSALRIAHQQSEITKLTRSPPGTNSSWGREGLREASTIPQTRHESWFESGRWLFSAPSTRGFSLRLLPSHFDASPSVHPLMSDPRPARTIGS